MVDTPEFVRVEIVDMDDPVFAPKQVEFNKVAFRVGRLDHAVLAD
jgi:hypothetical protein